MFGYGCKQYKIVGVAAIGCGAHEGVSCWPHCLLQALRQHQQHFLHSGYDNVPMMRTHSNHYACWCEAVLCAQNHSGYQPSNSHNTVRSW
jgi:hypothetical protein